MTLTPGRYVMFCNVRDVTDGLEEAPHYKLGMVRELMVVGGDPGRPSLRPTGRSSRATTVSTSTSRPAIGA